jgi:argininosuccinate lyase
MPENELLQSLNPTLNVDRRNGIGGPAPVAVKATIKTQRLQIMEEERRQTIRLDRITQAKDKLLEAEKRL